jgi:hypothetical protein
VLSPSAEACEVRDLGPSECESPGLESGFEEDGVPNGI